VLTKLIIDMISVISLVILAAWARDALYATAHHGGRNHRPGRQADWIRKSDPWKPWLADDSGWTRTAQSLEPKRPRDESEYHSQAEEFSRSDYRA
jgi:hypothetical protein